MLNNLEFLIFIKLLIAHLLTDFALQKKSWVADKQKNKIKSKKLYLHVCLTAIVAFLLSGQWQIWWLPFYIFITHLVIDIWKVYQKPKVIYFIVDQFLHIATLLLLVIILGNRWTEVFEVLKSIYNNAHFLLILTGYITVTYPLGILIGQLTQKWQQESQTKAN
jgi:hypothetical protein